jgi:hypothetical protein
VFDCSVVEALLKVEEHPLWTQYGPPARDAVAVFRPLNLSSEDVDKVVREARDHVGEKYGFGKLVLHFLDWCLLGAYVFRRLGTSERYPICSWLVADAFEAVGKRFGKDKCQAQPDDIWDFVTSHPKKYMEVRRLSPLPPR